MKNLSKTKVIKGDNYMLETYIDPFNKRVRIDDFQGNVEKVIDEAERLADNLLAEKLIIKVRQEYFSDFLAHGFICEAKLDQYFLGSDAYFFSKFFQIDRFINEHWIAENQTIEKILGQEKNLDKSKRQKDVALRKAELSDAVLLSHLYSEVFPVYPTPLHDPDYVAKTIKQGTIYFCIKQEDTIVSAASAEINHFYKNAELTDCATLMSHRKHGYVKLLLQRLEEELKRTGVFCAYSLSRAQSFGMNAAFYQLGYSYRGRLLNNCFIYSKLENMNLWVKDLSRNQGK